MSLWNQINQQISQATGQPFKAGQQQSIGGGCINEVHKISDGETSYFVKTNNISHGDMFAAEAEALLEMAETQTVKVPHPICYGDDGKNCFLVLEYLDLHGSSNMEEFGRQFAAMHKCSSKQFGWHRNNTIGSTPQINSHHKNWIDFWRENRLGYQLNLAVSKGYTGELQSLGEKLMADLPKLFVSYKPEVSMLHGDLWTGNASALSDGTAVIYDPAFYYGDREADLAMTQLFGSFSQTFYSSYNEVWPLDDGYQLRKTFYNLYHIINHLNLFGTGYLAQAINMTEYVLVEL